MATNHRTCEVRDCFEPVSCKKICRQHYLRQMRRCELEGCDRRVNSYGLCKPHHVQRTRGLALHEPRRSPKHSATLSERVWELVARGSESECWEWRGTVDNHGYGMMSYLSRSKKAHRLVWEDVNGPIVEGMVVDHICRVRHCVNPAHLQVVTFKQNLENHGGARPDSRSGIRGVRKLASGKWQVCVQDNGKRYYRSGFVTIGEAESAAIRLRNELHTNNLRDRKTDVSKPGGRYSP